MTAHARRFWPMLICVAGLGLWSGPVRADAAAEIFAERGLSALRARQFPQAQAQFEHALARDAKLPVAWLGLADALFWQERYPAALSAFERAHELAPKNAGGLGGIGHVCLNLATRTWQPPAARQALLLRARDAFNQALALDPKHQPSLDGIRYVADAFAHAGTLALSLQLLVATALVLFVLMLLRQRAQGQTALLHGARAALRAVLPAFLLTRALVLGGFWLAPLILDEAKEHPLSVLSGRDNPVLDAAAARWDSNLYATVALNGYEAQPPGPNLWGSLGQLPLLPVLYRWTMWLLGEAKLAALVLPHCALLLSGLVLFGLLRESEDEKLARRAVWVMFLLPGSLFASVLYAESLALVWLLIAYACLRREQYLAAALAGLLAGLARVNALAAVPLFALSAWRGRRTSPLALAATLGPAFGLLAFMLYTQHEFGDAFAYFHELRAHRFAGQGLAVAVGDARGLLAFTFGGAGAPTLSPVLVLVLAVGAISMLAYAAAGLQLLRKRPAEAAYIFAGMLLALGSNLAAQPRYLWLLFPASAVFARWASSGVRRAILGCLLAAVLFAEAVAYARWYYVT